MRKGFRSLTIGLFTLLLAVVVLPLTGQAKAVRKISKKNNIQMAVLTPDLQKKISDSTPAEPAGSDLELVHPATCLATARLPQGWTTDGIYYYYLTNLASYGSWKNSLRLTRVLYRADGSYSEDCYYVCYQCPRLFSFFFACFISNRSCASASRSSRLICLCSVFFSSRCL